MQRGLELAKQTATIQRRERKNSIPVRRSQSSTSVIASNAKNIPPSTDLARHADSQEHDSTENDLLQETVDNYVDLNGGYPEEDSVKREHNVEVRGTEWTRNPPLWIDGVLARTMRN